MYAIQGINPATGNMEEWVEFYNLAYEEAYIDEAVRAGWTNVHSIQFEL